MELVKVFNFSDKKPGFSEIIEVCLNLGMPCDFSEDINPFIPKKTGRNEGGGGGAIWPPPPCGFSKDMFCRVRVKLRFLVTFNIDISHIFPGNFIEILHLLQKIWRFYLSLLTIFTDFSDFWHFLFAKKLMASAYNRCCQHSLLWIYFK